MFIALIIQCISLFSACELLNLTHTIAGMLLGVELHFTLGLLILFVSLLSLLLTYLFGMEIWWWWIQALLPISLYFSTTWHISSWIYLIAFVISLSLFWTVAFSRVPFYPSKRIVWHKLVTLIPLQQEFSVIDIGSGIGDAALYIARLRPNSQVTGIEIAPLPWILSVFRGWVLRSTASFKWGDYRTLDFSCYNIVFAYLSPAVMSQLWLKAKDEMRPGSMLVSYEFDVIDVPPTQSIPLGNHDEMLYVWRID